MDHYRSVLSERDLLKALSKCKSKYRKSILTIADKPLIKAICECVYNVLLGNINLTDTNKQKLKKHKHILRKLIDKSSLKEKKKILIQKGGFLQFIIPAVITGLASIISSAISKQE